MFIKSKNYRTFVCVSYAEKHVALLPFAFIKINDGRERDLRMEQK